MAYRSKRKAAINAQLGDYVMGRLSEARTAWSPEYARMLKCCRLMRGLPYLPDDELTGNITFPVVPAITQAVEAAILDVFGDAISAPFTLKPSELPDLPPNIVQFLSQLLQQNIGMLEQVTGGDPAKVPLALQGLRETVKQQLEERATDAAGQMTDTIKTRMLQGCWTKAFTDFISNLTIYPTAILKGPYLKTVKARRWDETTGKLVFEDKAVWSFSNVNPFYFYPAPQAASVEEAEYVIEVQRIGAVDFAYLGLTDNYDADSVQDVQQEYPDGHLEPFFMGGERSPDYDFLQNAMSANIDTQGFYDVVCFSGRISGSILNALGGYNLNEYEWYKAEVEVCAGHVLKAVLNPNPSGNSRYHAMSLFPVAGSFFGESVPTRLLDVQRACEAALRALMRNMSYSSGPIFEVDIDRVSNDDDPTFIEPGVVKFTKQKWSGQNIPAYHVYNIPSHAAEIDNLMDKFIERGFTIIGFTPVSLGGQGEASTSRTVGGMSIQLNQSSKPLKKIVSSLGRDIITPSVQDLTDMEMMTSQDTSILGDILVHPTGVEGLADDEAKATRIQQAIQSCAGLAQFLSQPANPLTPLVMHLFSTWLKLEGIPTDGLQNFGMQDAFAQDTGAAYAGGTGQPNPAAPPMPQLDGRSGGAGPAISTNNDLSATMGGRSP